MSGPAAPAQAATQTPFYQIYRRSALGTALVEALDELINSGHINPQLALMTLNQFDKSASQTLQKDVKVKSTVKAHLKTYNHLEDVWTFILENPTFKFENGSETVHASGNCRIVACKSGDATTK
ncbi:Transcription initiation factor IIA subunit 2 [Rhodotorula toruloides]